MLYYFMTGKILEFNSVNVGCDISWYIDSNDFAMIKIKAGENEIRLMPLQAIEAIQLLAEMAHDSLMHNQENGNQSEPIL